MRDLIRDCPVCVRNVTMLGTYLMNREVFDSAQSDLRFIDTVDFRYLEVEGTL